MSRSDCGSQFGIVGVDYHGRRQLNLSIPISVSPRTKNIHCYRINIPESGFGLAEISAHNINRNIQMDLTLPRA